MGWCKCMLEHMVVVASDAKKPHRRPRCSLENKPRYGGHYLYELSFGGGHSCELLTRSACSHAQSLSLHGMLVPFLRNTPVPVGF